MIADFKYAMDNRLKSGGSISLDSAIWNMEAGLNYDYADPDSASAFFITRASSYILDVDAGQYASLLDVATVYDQMEDTLLIQFQQLVNTVKIIVMCDVALDSTDAGYAYLTLTNGFGLDLASQYEPFDEDDDWIWGDIFEIFGYPPPGKCDSTEYGVSDGSNELSKRLNNPYLQTGEQYFFTDIETFEVNFYNCVYYEPPQLPRVFSVYQNGDFCMDNDTLTFYLEAADWIIYDYNDPSNDIGGIFLADGEGARPFGKDFISIQIEDEFSLNDITYFHNYLISYGLKNQVPPSN
ncbi:MAG: hypothetical protein P8100_12535 [bacterium]